MLRYDMTTDYWVIYAPRRAKRPHDFRRAIADEPASPEPPHLSCPFCPGNEHMTPGELDATRAPGDPPSHWTVRVLPNLYPALVPDEAPSHVEEGPYFYSMGSHGKHEVVVESPDHHCFLGFQPTEQVVAVLEMLAKRARILLMDPGTPMVVLFKNHGEEAGTSLRHPHWQIIAAPVVSRRIRTRLRLATQFSDRRGKNLYETLRDEEIAAGSRVLIQSERFVAVLPYASHTPFEVWIIPRFRQPSFPRTESSDLVALAVILRRVLLRLYIGLGNPAFNLSIDTVPRGDEDREDFLWTLQIRPRLSSPAGFEMGTGMFINTVLPEAACAYLSALDDPRLDF